MNGKRIDQKGRGKKKEYGRVEMEAMNTELLNEKDERDMREKRE